MIEKRQCIYAMRRKRARELRSEVRKLEFQIAMLKSPVVATSDKKLRKATAEQAELLAIGRNNQLQVAKAQSAISGCMGDYDSYPLHSKIRLSDDWDQRRATLLSIREEKLRAAYDFVMDPTGLLDDEGTRYADEMFETDDGDWCCIRFETIQFPNVESIEQVFDAVMSYFKNTELLISERPGNFAVRDDYECLEGGITNSRVIATNSTGITMEASTLVISQLLNEGDARFGGEQIGIIAIDSVDEDKLFPWVSTERVRQDGTGAIVLTASRSCDASDGSSSTGSTSSEEDNEVTVTMRRATYVKLYQPDFPLSEEEQQDLRDGFTRAGEFMRKAIRRIVYNQH
ncbi:hypothetical protein F442_16507 [Phytophthora nicotianae P10297]|uniref:Uncharacterized protein n=1 Tax=Phytophthora nicotianae P10297 TaxID=1317064 RepID=W2YJQ3_PHYNI|nr:hypothetical protein F442_16507 [Phytophthora nicotianae P10297]